MLKAPAPLQSARRRAGGPFPCCADIAGSRCEASAVGKQVWVPRCRTAARCRSTSAVPERPEPMTEPRRTLLLVQSATVERADGGGCVRRQCASPRRPGGCSPNCLLAFVRSANSEQIRRRRLSGEAAAAPAALKRGCFSRRCGHAWAAGFDRFLRPDSSQAEVRRRAALTDGLLARIPPAPDVLRAGAARTEVASAGSDGGVDGRHSLRAL